MSNAAPSSAFDIAQSVKAILTAAAASGSNSAPKSKAVAHSPIRRSLAHDPYRMDTPQVHRSPEPRRDLDWQYPRHDTSHDDDYKL